MQLIGVVLLIISIGLVVGPVGAVVIMYSDNLTGLVIPPEFDGLLNGDPSFIFNDNFQNGEGGETGSVLDSFVTPQFVSADIDSSSKTFTVIVNVTNTLKFDLTLNTLRTDVQTPDNQEDLATVSLSNPLTFISGQSSNVTIVGSWTPAGETYIMNHLQNDEEISVSLVNLSIDVNGIKVDLPGPFTVPLSTSGLTFPE